MEKRKQAGVTRIEKLGPAAAVGSDLLEVRFDAANGCVTQGGSVEPLEVLDVAFVTG